jgi:hypothetical protein
VQQREVVLRLSAGELVIGVIRSVVKVAWISGGQRLDLRS